MNSSKILRFSLLVADRYRRRIAFVRSARAVCVIFVSIALRKGGEAMVTLRFSGNISAEATTQFGNILPEAMRGLHDPLNLYQRPFASIRRSYAELI